MFEKIAGYLSPHRVGGGSPTASFGSGDDGEEPARKRKHKNGRVDRKVRKSQRTLREQLERTEELLAARTNELSGTHAFLSTADRLSEVEVLAIVRDLNENIYQVAVQLTEEWEKFDPPPATGREGVAPTSRPRVPALLQLVRNRDPASLTFLLQSWLCSQVVGMTSSWSHDGELALLESIYQRLSASGEYQRQRQVICNSRVTEGQAVSARWRSLTHSYLSRSPPRPELLLEGLAKILDNTGSFPTTQQSLEFVRVTVLKGIESIIRLSQRSEFAFMVQVTSSDMSLSFEAPGVEFDGAKMASEHGTDGIQGERGRIAGTTEVGVRKSRRGGRGESQHTEILLRTKVVLEKDVIGVPSAGGKVESSAPSNDRDLPSQSGQLRGLPSLPGIDPPDSRSRSGVTGPSVIGGP